MFACIMTRASRDAPQSYATPEILLNALTPYGQDDVQGQWSDDRMLMVQALTWNTPQSRFETAPEVCKETGRVMVAWARLDNRADLCAKLNLTDCNTLTDPQLILESHRRWGGDCPDQLEGDFSFVIYDPVTGQTFCARDSIGAKPFFYYNDAKVFIAGSTAAIFPILKTLTFPPSPAWMARYMLKLPHEVTASAFEDVARLAPAHSLQVARDGTTEPHEYFRFEDTAPMADLRDPKYVEDYRAAFHRATEARLRCDFFVGAENSGGLDSVSIMGHAVKHLPHDMEDFHCFGLPKQEKDQGLILEASMHAGVRHTHLATHMKSLADLENFDRAVRTLGHPVEHSQINMHMAALRQSQAFGIRTMLSGYGGDEIVTNQAGALDLELYTNRQFKTMLREMPGDVLTSRLRFLKRLYGLRRRNTYSAKSFYILARNLKFSPMRQEVVEDLGIIRDQKAQIAYAAQSDTLNEQILRGLAFRRSRVGRLEACAVMAQSHRVEYRWPLYDRQLMQHYLRTPAIEKRHKGMGRYLHRRAVAGTIPDAIAWQQSKDMGNLVTNALGLKLPDLLDEGSVSPHLASLLDFEKLRKMHTDLQNTSPSNTTSEQFLVQWIALWSTIALARWLET